MGKFFDPSTLKFAPDVEREHLAWRRSRIIELRREGLTQAAIAEYLRCSKVMVRSVLKAAGMTRPRAAKPVVKEGSHE